MLKINKQQSLSVVVFMLLYYIYMNAVRKVMIPFSSVTIPLLLAICLFLILKTSRGKLYVNGFHDRFQCFSWIFIAVLIFINNSSLTKNLISGGMIQFYVAICFLLFASKSDCWLEIWLKWTEIFVMVHAFATILFYFNSSLYNKFANSIFSGSELVSVLHNYKRGYMCGLSSHFSSNGMILGVGLIVLFEHFMSLKIVHNQNEIKSKWIIAISSVITLYALILSSKRAILIASVFSLAITYIIRTNRNVGKRLLILLGACVVAFIAYYFFAPKIPGLATIVDKFIALENSDAGLLNGRAGLWDRAIQMFKSNPIFGNGYGSYSVYAVETSAITTSAHNYYLQVLAELGIVGGILYLIAFISGGLSTFKLLQLQYKRPNSTRSILFLSIAFDIQIFVLAYNMSATAMMYYSILIPYFLACSVTRAIDYQQRV